MTAQEIANKTIAEIKDGIASGLIDKDDVFSVIEDMVRDNIVINPDDDDDEADAKFNMAMEVEEIVCDAF